METINSFQSSLPVGGATTILEVKPDEEVISIHAPRGGSDVRHIAPPADGDNFNPRSPWGERHRYQHQRSRQGYFNPRSPWGERLTFPDMCDIMIGFQSTLPVGERLTIKPKR